MQDQLTGLSTQLADAAAHAGPYVLTVHGRHRISSSGIHWKPGVIITADHALRKDEDIRLTLPDGSQSKAELAGRDPSTDLAVLRAETHALPTAPAPAENLRAGALALTIGRSPENGIAVAMGVVSTVSGPSQTWRGGRLDRLIRLDLNLFPGSTGGAVIAATGGFIGLATGALSRTAPFAIPSETIDRVATALLQHGRLARGYLGVGLQSVVVIAGDHQRQGLILLSVEPNGPAAKAGLLVGDVLLEFNGTPVRDPEDVHALLGPESVGKQAEVHMSRAGALISLPITIEERSRRRA